MQCAVLVAVVMAAVAGRSVGLAVVAMLGIVGVMREVRGYRVMMCRGVVMVVSKYAWSGGWTKQIGVD